MELCRQSNFAPSPYIAAADLQGAGDASHPEELERPASAAGHP